MQIIHCFIHRCLYSLFILFCSLISVFKKQNTEKMLTVSYSYNWQKFKNKMNEKWDQEYQSMDPEYVTRQIIVFWSFFWDDFIVWFKYRLDNPNMLIKRFLNNHKRHSSHLQVLILHRVALIKVYLKNYESLKKSHLKFFFIP